MADDRKRGFQAGSSYTPALGPNPFLAREFSARPKAPVRQTPSAVEKAWIASEETFCFDAFSPPSSTAPSEPEQILSLRPDMHVSTSDRVASPAPSRPVEVSSKPSRKNMRLASIGLLFGTALASSAGLAVFSWKQGSPATASRGDGDRGGLAKVDSEPPASTLSGRSALGSSSTLALAAKEPALASPVEQSPNPEPRRAALAQSIGQIASPERPDPVAIEGSEQRPSGLTNVAVAPPLGDPEAVSGTPSLSLHAAAPPGPPVDGSTLAEVAFKKAAAEISTLRSKPADQSEPGFFLPKSFQAVSGPSELNDLEAQVGERFAAPTATPGIGDPIQGDLKLENGPATITAEDPVQRPNALVDSAEERLRSESFKAASAGQEAATQLARSEKVSAGEVIPPENREQLLVTGSNVPAPEVVAPTATIRVIPEEPSPELPNEGTAAKDRGQSIEPVHGTLPSTPPDPAAAAALHKRATSLLRLGDVAAARLFLQRAAELGSLEASAELQTLSPARTGPSSNAAATDGLKQRR